MAFIDDLAKASSLFNQNATALATQQRVNEASGAMEGLKEQLAQGQIKEMEFRKQSRDLAEALRMQLVGVGADAATTQQAFQAIAPQQFGNAIQAFQAGEVELAEAMDSFMWEAKEQQLDRALEDRMKIVERQGELRSEAAGANRAARLEDQKELLKLRAEITANKPVKLRPLKETTLKRIETLEEGFNTAQMLVEMNAKGDFTGIQGNKPFRKVFNKKQADFESTLGRWFADYKKEISGTAVSAQELKFLEEVTPQVSDTDIVFNRKMRTIADLGKVGRARVLLNRARNGENVKMWKDKIQAGHEAAARLNADYKDQNLNIKINVPEELYYLRRKKDNPNTKPLKKQDAGKSGARKHLKVY